MGIVRELIHPYESSLPVEYDRTAVSVVDVDELTFARISPSLTMMREIVYGIYTKDGLQPIAEYKPDSPELHSRFLIAQYLPKDHSLERFFRQSRSQQQIDLSSLKLFTSTLGFMKLEWGQNMNGKPLLEAGELIKWSGWPKDNIGYVGAFTPHTLIPRSMRLDAQTEMLRRARDIAIENGFLRNFYAIMIETVQKFAKESGVEMELVDEARVNVDSQVVQELMRTYPGYWSADPKLYRVNLEGV